MVFNNNHNNKKIRDEINKLVGTPYSLMQRIKRGGIGSGKLLVESKSPEMQIYFDDNLDLHYVNIELRPLGILVYIKNKINDYVWAIPYYHLTIYQSKNFSLRVQAKILEFSLLSIFPKHKKFITKMLGEKSDFAKDRKYLKV